MDMLDWENTRKRVVKVLDSDSNAIISQTILNIIREGVALYPSVANKVIARVNKIHPIPENKMAKVFNALTSEIPTRYNAFGQALKS